jgi:hypothetical protein
MVDASLKSDWVRIGQVPSVGEVSGKLDNPWVQPRH